jgi:hypothetical protein
MPAQKDHSPEAYERAWRDIQALHADLRQAEESVRRVIPKTYARGLDRIASALIDLESEIELRSERDKTGTTGAGRKP